MCSSDLKLMVLVVPLAVCTRVLGMYFLIPRKLEKLLAWSGVTSAVINLAVAIPLAGHWGATGMVVARLVSEGSLLVMLIIGSWRAGLVRKILGISEEFSWQTRFGRRLE